MNWLSIIFPGSAPGQIGLNFARKGNSKGGRLAEYLKEKGYLPEQMIAIGDNHNDISMIKLAGLGVAMKNAGRHSKIGCRYDLCNR